MNFPPLLRPYFLMAIQDMLEKLQRRAEAAAIVCPSRKLLAPGGYADFALLVGPVAQLVRAADS